MVVDGEITVGLQCYKRNNHATTAAVVALPGYVITHYNVK